MYGRDGIGLRACLLPLLQLDEHRIRVRTWNRESRLPPLSSRQLRDRRQAKVAADHIDLFI